MNRILEASLLVLLILLFCVAIVAIFLSTIIISNNIGQEYECEKMNDYGYTTELETYRLIDTCYIIMEDGAKIRSNDYVISDDRDPKMLYKFVSTRVNESE